MKDHKNIKGNTDLIANAKTGKWLFLSPGKFVITKILYINVKQQLKKYLL